MAVSTKERDAKIAIRQERFDRWASLVGDPRFDDLAREDGYDNGRDALETAVRELGKVGVKVDAPEVHDDTQEALDYLANYAGDFQFLVDVKARASRGLSPKQVAAVLKCKARDRSRPAPAPKQSTVTEPGIYERDGEVFKVQKSRSSDRLYAKRLIPAPSDRLTESGVHERWEFEYAPGVIFTLTPEHRMGIEEAKTFGIRFGICACCGKVLKRADSVERGIGPVCRKWFSF